MRKHDGHFAQLIADVRRRNAEAKGKNGGKTSDISLTNNKPDEKVAEIQLIDDEITDTNNTSSSPKITKQSENNNLSLSSKQRATTERITTDRRSEEQEENRATECDFMLRCSGEIILTNTNLTEETGELKFNVGEPEPEENTSMDSEVTLRCSGERILPETNLIEETGEQDTDTLPESPVMLRRFNEKTIAPYANHLTEKTEQKFSTGTPEHEGNTATDSEVTLPEFSKKIVPDMSLLREEMVEASPDMFQASPSLSVISESLRVDIDAENLSSTPQISPSGKLIIV